MLSRLQARIPRASFLRGSAPLQPAAGACHRRSAAAAAAFTVRAAMVGDDFSEAAKVAFTLDASANGCTGACSSSFGARVFWERGGAAERGDPAAVFRVRMAPSGRPASGIWLRARMRVFEGGGRRPIGGEGGAPRA
jgi:hypothetical protein